MKRLVNDKLILTVLFVFLIIIVIFKFVLSGETYQFVVYIIYTLWFGVILIIYCEMCNWSDSIKKVKKIER